jgi:hypothetical protein
MKKKYWGILFLLMPLVSYSQYQNPSSIRWRQIKTEHFTVVFPADILSRGEETANLLEYVYRPVSNSLKEYPKKISVFLFDQSAISNGFTTLAPRYVGFFTTPPQDATLIGGADWLQSLATHEYRHVVQFSKFDKNFTSFMGHVMGDYGRLIMMNWSTPQWFFEGDAVCTETALSEDGRGRMPFFTRDIRALELEDIRYSYDKAYLGSYKNHIPDYYHLGYLLTAYVTKNFGIDAWNKVMTRVSIFSFSPFSFSKGLRQFTGSNLNKTYKNALNEYNVLWNSKIENYPYTRFKRMNHLAKKAWTNYSQAFFVTSDSLIALKNGLDDPPTLVLITQDKEKKLRQINPIDRIHSNGQLIVWSSETADLRWGQRSYADVMIYDLAKHSKKKLTHKGKYYAPAISPDGTQIAAVEYNNSMKCALVILDAKKGKVLNRFNIPDSSFIRMPSWSEDGKTIVFTQTHGQLKTISVLNLESGEIKNTMPYSAENISNPVFFKNLILYNSPSTGIDAIFALNTEDGSRTVVATGKYGVYNPAVSHDRKSIAFENYTTNGFDIASIKVDLDTWTPVNNFEYAGDDYYKYLLQNLNAKNIFDSIPAVKNENFKSKKYIPLFHSINLHSWMPTYGSGGIGLQLISSDKLNTTWLSGGFDYFPSEKATLEYANLTYAKFFPVFDFGILYGRRYNTLDYFGTSIYVKLNEKVANAKVTLPFNFSRNIYTTTLSVFGGYDYIYDYMPTDQFPSYVTVSNNTTITSAVEGGLLFSNMKQMALRDINPKFGQSLNLNFWDTPFENGTTSGKRYIADALFYFPGMFKHHSTSLSFGYEYNTDDFIGGVYQLTTDLPFVRGFSNVDYTRLLKGMFTYGMPLFYPDFHIGSFIYCKRVRSDLFFDYGVANYNNINTTYNSAGFDLNAEFNFFRIPIPFEMGVRYSYRISDNKNAFDFLFLGIAF